MKRKDFLQSVLGASAFIGLSLASCNEKENLQELVNNTKKKVNGNMFGFSVSEIEKVRVGIIGLGNRGTTLLQMFQYLVEQDYAEIVAICDIQEHKTQKAADILKQWQSNQPTVYKQSEDDWQNLAKRDDVDLLIIATPWSLHTTMAIFGM